MATQSANAQSEALAGRHAARAARALIGRRLADRRDQQRLHAGARREALLLAEARVDHVHNAVDGERRLGNVGRQHHLARAGWRRLENARLRMRGSGGEEGRDGMRENE